MEVVLGALPSLLPKLGELLADEYNLQKEVKGGIRFLQAELESMKAALEDISKIPPDQLPSGDKIWARNVRELSYDIEDNIDMFMVQVKGHQLDKKHGFKKFVDKTLGSLMQPKIRRKIAIDIRDIKSRVVEVHDRRRRYEVNHNADNKLVKVDPLALVAMVRYKNPTELVGIEESRDEVIKILIEGNEASSKEQKKIVSIAGFGGLGKTTLANAVYEKVKSQFHCSAFVSVSQTPDMDKLFKNMFYQLTKNNTDSIDVIDELRGFLLEKSSSRVRSSKPPGSRRLSAVASGCYVAGGRRRCSGSREVRRSREAALESCPSRRRWRPSWSRGSTACRGHLGARTFPSSSSSSLSTSWPSLSTSSWPEQQTEASQAYCRVKWQIDQDG